MGFFLFVERAIPGNTYLDMLEMYAFPEIEEENNIEATRRRALNSVAMSTLLWVISFLTDGLVLCSGLPVAQV